MHEIGLTAQVSTEFGRTDSSLCHYDMVRLRNDAVTARRQPSRIAIDGRISGLSELLHLRIAQLPVEKVEVLEQVRALARLRNDGDSLLHEPFERHLRPRLIVRGADACHKRSRDELGVRGGTAWPAERRETLVQDAMSPIERPVVHSTRPLRAHANVELDLIHSHLDLGDVEHVLKMALAVCAISGKREA